MSSKIYQRQVSDTTATTGFGDITLDGLATAGSNYLGGVAADLDLTTLVIQDALGNYEVVEGHVHISAANVVTFSRESPISSSNDNDRVNFPAGTKSVKSLTISDGLKLVMDREIRDALSVIMDTIQP